MSLKEAIEILEHHQAWRLGKIDKMPYDPKIITQAIDIAINGVKKLK